VKFNADKKSRPVLDIPRSQLENTIEIVAIAALLSTIIYAVAYWSELPDRIPVHFGMDGTPDGWGTKLLMLLPLGVSVVIYIGLTTLSRYPHIYNYPWAITPENAPKMYALARLFMTLLKCEIVLLFSSITYATIATALGAASGLGLVSVPLIMAFVFGTIAWYFWSSYKVC